MAYKKGLRYSQVKTASSSRTILGELFKRIIAEWFGLEFKVDSPCLASAARQAWKVIGSLPALSSTFLDSVICNGDIIVERNTPNLLNQAPF